MVLVVLVVIYRHIYNGKMLHKGQRVLRLQLMIQMHQRAGWWHWQIVNIPVNVKELGKGVGDTTINNAPTGSTQINNDYGSRGFGGACPPVDHGVHHYRFTIHALSVEKLELPEDASGALAGYMINAHTIESSTIESLYKR